MFVNRVKIEEWTEQSGSLLILDLGRSEASLRERRPVKDVSVLADGRTPNGELDIIDGEQVRGLIDELRTIIGYDMAPANAPEPRVSTELIHI